MPSPVSTGSSDLDAVLSGGFQRGEPPRVSRRLSYVSPATMAGVCCCW